jgi:hypothetical protein
MSAGIQFLFLVKVKSKAPIVTRPTARQHAFYPGHAHGAVVFAVMKAQVQWANLPLSFQKNMEGGIRCLKRK